MAQACASRKRSAPVSASASASSRVPKPPIEELIGESRGTPFAPAPKDERRLTSRGAIGQALEHLECDPDLAPLVHRLDPRSVWSSAGRSDDGSVSSLTQFLCLAEARLRCRISVALANTLLREVKTACSGAVTPASVVANAEPLRSLLDRKYLGKPKFDALQALAVHWRDMPDYSATPSRDVVATLTSVRGFGEATVLTFLVKALARVDVLVESDCLVRAWLDRRKGVSKDGANAQAMRDRLAATAVWKPWRSVGCLLIWSDEEDSCAGVATVLG